jgi:hypothetical protein
MTAAMTAALAANRAVRAMAAAANTTAALTKAWSLSAAAAGDGGGLGQLMQLVVEQKFEKSAGTT